MSDGLSDNEEDPGVLWAEIHRLRAAVAGPAGYASWQDAATAERVRRVKAEQALAAERWMPVLGHPLAIRAELLDARQAMTNHGQTLERRAERGGLSLDEAAAIVEQRRWCRLTADEAMDALKRAAERHRRRPVSEPQKQAT